MADLLNVPLEVLLQITSYLTIPEYGYFRRTCKQLEALLFGAFAREFFSKKQFALIEFSIQALVDIAKSRLGPSMTHLIIHVEHPCSHYPASITIAPRDKAIRDNRYRAACINHMEFITTGLDVEMLSDAIKHLPNLETVGIRDFHSRNPSRDNTIWHSYGCPTFLKQTIHPLVLPNTSRGYIGSRHRGTEYIGHIFLTILRAIGNAEASGQSSKVTRIEILLHTSHLPDQTFKIPDRFQSVVSLALSRLKTIFLDGLSESMLDFVVADVGAGADPIIGLGYFLSRFLARLSALQHLRLNFQACDSRSVERILLWLANARSGPTHAAASPVDAPPSAQDFEDLPTHLPPAPSFPNLQNLDLGMTTVSESVLLALYKNYKSTLRGISLHKIRLACKHDTRVNLWARLCNKMAAADLQLQTLGLSYLTQASGEQDTHRPGQVTFKGSKNPNVKTWRGSTFSQSVKDITDEMESYWEERSREEDDDESMEDDDDDDDD